MLSCFQRILGIFIPSIIGLVNLPLPEISYTVLFLSIDTIFTYRRERLSSVSLELLLALQIRFKLFPGADTVRI